MRKTASGFTLLEMMVSIAIIALLAGMFLGGFNAATERAKKARARSDVHQIAGAWEQYFADRIEFPSGINSMDDEACRILGGGDSVNNPLGLAYLDFNLSASVLSYNDPWNMPYQVALSDDGEVSPSGHGDIQVSVAVWSLGPTGTNNAIATPSADDIGSWMDN